MRNLLIVDDEKNIRMGLQAMIERQYPGSYRVFLAADGREALNILKNTHMELLITDIRMPVMDGLRLLEELQGFPVKPVSLILSGYDDFQYAREAIRYEVRDYLLKPIVRTDLFQALERMEQELRRREKLSIQLHVSDRRKEEFLSSELSVILLHPDIPPQEIRSRLHKAGMSSFDGGYWVGVLQLYANGEPMSREEMLIHINTLLQEQNEGMKPRLIPTSDRSGRSVLIADREDAFRLLMKRLDQLLHLTASLGISEGWSGLENLKVAYQQAAQALKYAFLLDTEATIPYSTIRGRTAAPSIPVDAIRRIANMLGGDREKEIRSLLLDVFDVQLMETCDIAYMEGVGRALNELVFDEFFRQYGEASIEIIRLHKKAGTWEAYRCFHDYYRDVEGLLFRMNDFIKTMKTLQVGQKEMSKAIPYIHAHYTDPELSMTMVSNHVSLNYSYFSMAFKEYTGESFVQYLKKLRITKACELLEGTDEKIYEIGSQVGFENTKHFIRVFRELEGVTPSEYRSRRAPLHE